MAVRAYTVTKKQTNGDNTWTVVWTGLTQATSDTGEPFPMPGAADRSVQVTGTFGAGGNCRIEGTNAIDASGTYATLTDPQGNALDYTAAKIEAVTEITNWIRPNITAGDGTTAITVTMLVRRLS